MSTAIRPLVKKDREVIRKILENTPEFTAEEVTVAVELIDIYLKDGTASGYYCAASIYNDVPSGYVCYGPTPMTQGTWDVYWIAVDSKIQRQGIGRALMQYAEDEMMKSGARLILIETSGKPSYDRTRKFYQSIDYTAVSVIPDFYAVGDDRVIFQKKFG
jgi:ribosomal protein S18 acetylase RimI-like enzyme